MKCPVCEKENNLSGCWSSGSTTTLAYYQSFYTKDGVYHNHDSNDITTNFRCELNHEWREITHLRCPVINCGFNNFEAKIVVNQ